MSINTHGMVIEFGKHKGELWTRVPVSYLLWAANASLSNGNSAIARAELDRRGTAYPSIEISGHAIDRASLHCRKIWHEDRGESEGLYSWLIRVGQEAIEHGERSGDKFCWKNMRFVFEFGAHYPVMKTVMRKKNAALPDCKADEVTP